jgi:hypothetical protein
MKAFWELVLAHDALRPFVAGHLTDRNADYDALLELGSTIYVACTLTHKGQWSEEYAIMGAYLGNIGFTHEREIQESELFAEIMTALGGA